MTQQYGCTQVRTPTTLEHAFQFSSRLRPVMVSRVTAALFIEIRGERPQSSGVDIEWRALKTADLTGRTWESWTGACVHPVLRSPIGEFLDGGEFLPCGGYICHQRGIPCAMFELVGAISKKAGSSPAAELHRDGFPRRTARSTFSVCALRLLL
jgi:hypothetical protein